MDSVTTIHMEKNPPLREKEHSRHCDFAMVTFLPIEIRHGHLPLSIVGALSIIGGPRTEEGSNSDNTVYNASATGRVSRTEKGGY